MSTSKVSSDSSTLALEELIENASRYLKPRQSRWLRPLSAFAKLIQAGLFCANWLLMRLLFRLSVTGSEKIPSGGPHVLAPNHTSSLDPCAIAAAVTLGQLRSLRWAAREGVVIGGVLREVIARLARVLPIQRSIESLAAASIVLNRGENLVWFPEGTRSETGELQPLKPGIGHLACHHRVPVIPVIISGARTAMPPPRKRLRRLSKISVQFGTPQVADSDCDTCADEFVEELRAGMDSLLAGAGHQQTNS